ncbi:MAG: hypothetical protein HZB26_01100 [Candidatus Hydrogenedentes bacterium]|nr:hypothetical protein [Candidatus Hydrogenedentota bacterium]
MPAASKTPEYEKLTHGVRRYVSPFVAPRYRLWLAKDHLLHICDTGYTESYKRFYFQDIQAIVVSATQTGKLRNVLFGVLTVLSGMLAFSGYRWWAWDGGGVVFVAGVAAFFFLMLVINILRGPTCQCVLYTGVHAEPIRALDRLRKARRTLQRLQPLIEAAQGGLSDEQLAEKRAALSGATATRRVTPPSKLESRGPLRHDEGRWHALLLLYGTDSRMPLTPRGTLPFFSWQSPWWSSSRARI